MQRTQHQYGSLSYETAGAVLKAYGYDFGTVWDDLPEKIKDLLWYGSGEEKFSFVYENMQGEVKKHTTAFEGIIPMLRLLAAIPEAFS